MSDFSNLTVTLSNPPDDSDRPSGEDIWIRLEQVGDGPDTATPTETAELVDAVFQITPCDEPPEEQEQPDPVPPEDFPAVVQDKFDMSICDKLGDHSFVVQIKVLRSDNSYPYTLRLTNGEVLKTETVSDSITEYLVINDRRSAELSHPPSTSVSLSWHLAPDSEVAITNNGSNIELSEQATGTVEAEYQSTYDLITVKCYSEGCVALAFYRGALDELELQKPDIGDPTDEEISQFCNPDETWEIEFKEGPHICHEIVHYQTLDDCDSSEVDVRTEDETIDCWKDFGPCYHENGCYHLKGSRTVTVGYTNAGTEDRVHDPDFYRETCCEDWPFPYDMPRCQEVTSKNLGGKTLSQEDVAKYKGLYGDNTVFIPVTPKDGDCGKTVVRQRILAQNCCPGYSIDLFSSVLGRGQSTQIIAINSELHTSTVELKVEGHDWWLDVTTGSGHVYCKRYITDRLNGVYSIDPYVKLVCDSDACGSAIISLNVYDYECILSTVCRAFPDGYWGGDGNICEGNPGFGASSCSSSLSDPNDWVAFTCAPAGSTGNPSFRRLESANTRYVADYTGHNCSHYAPVTCPSYGMTYSILEDEEAHNTCGCPDLTGHGDYGAVVYYTNGECPGCGPNCNVNSTAAEQAYGTLCCSGFSVWTCGRRDENPVGVEVYDDRP